MNVSPVFYCVDDYGMTPLTSDRIDECLVHGAANKIAVFPNTNMTDIPERLASMKQVSPSVHITLVEGKCLSAKENLPLLVDQDGHFTNSFFELLVLSLSSCRKDFSRQIYIEMKAQILNALTLFPKGTPIMLDSHQHVHMIPAIFSQLMQVVRDLNLDVSYIRIPAEPILPYLCSPSLYPQYCSINAIKHWVLKFCHLFNRKKLAESGIPTALFCGIMFSGNMNYDRMKVLIPKYLRLAKKKGCGVEFLFHCGYTNPGEPLFDERKIAFHSFYYSEGRKNEYDALMKLKQSVTQ